MRGSSHRVWGVEVDSQTRCLHYRGGTDIIAIKFACCRTYYACHACHEALARHPARTWKAEDFEQRAVLCGACRTELTITQYLANADGCPECRARFNPACRSHHPLYFEDGSPPRGPFG